MMKCIKSSIRPFKALYIGLTALGLTLVSMSAWTKEQQVQDCRIVATYIERQFPPFAQDVEHSEAGMQNLQSKTELLADPDNKQRLSMFRQQVLAMKQSTDINKTALWNAQYQKRCASTFY
ncbi:hypothetical protein [Corallincola spongiicola]|uniref:Uncharacterized protein n=1 Tax=Corallincola spongiicola TaxID=2520508 RepID=A0ABY1WUJ5_9GAMM|nr:hypothetical protein [Corallincola spongiicola]TAA48347.1 hypothetical protein EXY25_03705 [Corallincola spongiicola]